MTTIVYDHKAKQVAVDSRLCRSDIICSDEFEKFKIIKGNVWFFCGVFADHNLLVDWFEANEKPSLVPDCEAIVIRDGKAFSYYVAEHGAANILELNFSEVIGSGQKFALSALDFGRSASEAVEYAKTRDCGTGGHVHVFDVATSEKIK